MHDWLHSNGTPHGPVCGQDDIFTDHLVSGSGSIDLVTQPSVLPTRAAVACASAASSRTAARVGRGNEKANVVSIQAVNGVVVCRD